VLLTTADLVLRAARAVTTEGERSAAIAVTAGQIVSVEEFTADIQARTEIHVAEDVVLLPGLVDTHVHLQDPGRADWEGFESGREGTAADPAHTPRSARRTTRQGPHCCSRPSRCLLRS
jgi:allantoinase